MPSDDRTFSVGQIRAASEEIDRQMAVLQQRQDAYHKLLEGAEALELAEREMSSGATTEAPPAAPPPHSSGRARTGDRALMILQSDPSLRWTPRDVWEQMVERGWAQDTKDARTAIRVALKRLEEREERVTRTEAGMTHAYQWMTADSDQLALASNGHAQAPGWTDWRN